MKRLSRAQFDLARLALAAALLGATLLRPTLPLERARFDHVVVLDITQSMNVEDETLAGRPASRLAFAKDALARLLPALPCGSRVGWGVFTEYRSLLLMAPIEVCAHRADLRATLARIDGRMAWSGNSEVAKGLHSGWTIAKELPDSPSLVFITDGHEAPPLSPRHRPRFDDKPGDVKGVIVGVGGVVPQPIPKTDPLGRPLGFWRADEVLQTDTRSQGRAGSVGNETQVDDPADPAAPALPDATKGSEQLSGLHEAYLRLLSSELGLGFHHLQSAEGLADALRDPALARPERGPVDLRPALATIALLLLASRHVRWPRGWPTWRRWNRWRTVRHP